MSICDIKKNDLFSESNIYLRRPGNGDFGVDSLASLFGKKATKDIKNNHQIKKKELYVPTPRRLAEMRTLARKKKNLAPFNGKIVFYVTNTVLVVVIKEVMLLRIYSHLVLEPSQMI